VRRKVSVWILVLVLFALSTAPVLAFVLPEGFAYVTDVIATAELEVRYYGDNKQLLFWLLYFPRGLPM